MYNLTTISKDRLINFITIIILSILIASLFWETTIVIGCVLKLILISQIIYIIDNLIKILLIGYQRQINYSEHQNNKDLIKKFQFFYEKIVVFSLLLSYTTPLLCISPLIKYLVDLMLFASSLNQTINMFTYRQYRICFLLAPLKDKILTIINREIIKIINIKDINRYESKHFDLTQINPKIIFSSNTIEVLLFIPRAIAQPTIFDAQIHNDVGV